MNLKGKKIGVAFTGSFCTYEKAFLALEKLVGEGAKVQPVSYTHLTLPTT